MTISGLDSAALVVNDWATKKGWNDAITTADSVRNHEIAMVGLLIKALCGAIESIREGHEIPSDVRQMIYDHVIIEDERQLGRLDKVELRQMAQAALMHTELAELSEAILDRKTEDDHVQKLDGKAAELADLFIRMAHFAGEHGVKFGEAVAIKHEYNTQRKHKHGKKA